MSIFSLSTADFG